MKSKNSFFIWMLAIALSTPLNADDVAEQEAPTPALDELIAEDNIESDSSDAESLIESVILDADSDVGAFADHEKEDADSDTDLVKHLKKDAAELLPSSLTEEERRQIVKEEEKAILMLLSDNQKARIFVIWSAGLFGSIRSVFLGGSEKEQDDFFQKVRRFLLIAEQLRAKKRLSDAKLVFDLVLDETTLKKALPFIQKIEAEFPGCLRIEIMEKLLKRIRAAAGKPQQHPESFAHHFSGAAQASSPFFLDSINIAERFDFSAISDEHMALLTNIFANALNGNPALSSDVLRILLLNDQAFDWNVYTDVDTFNANGLNQRNLVSIIDVLEVSPGPQITFPHRSNDVIIGHELSLNAEARNLAQEAANRFLNSVYERSGAPSDILNAYRDQIKMIKYDYPAHDSNNPEVQSAQRVVDQYLDKLEKYANLVNKKGGYNLADEVIYTTGPGQMEKVRGEMDQFIQNAFSSKSGISAQTWLEGKLTRWNEYFGPADEDTLEGSEENAQFIAFLLFLDDWELLKKTNDVQFLKTIIKTIQKRWKNTLITGLSKSWVFSYKRLFTSFLNACIKARMPSEIRENWDAFANALKDEKQSDDDLYKNFKAQIDWANTIVFDKKNKNQEDLDHDSDTEEDDDIKSQETDISSSTNSEGSEEQQKLLSKMISFVYSIRESFLKHAEVFHFGETKMRNVEDLKNKILEGIPDEPEEHKKKWRDIFNSLISNSALPLRYLEDLASFINLEPIWMSTDSESAETVSLYDSMIDILKNTNLKKGTAGITLLKYHIKKKNWLNASKFEELITQSAKNTLQCPFSKNDLFNHLPSELSFDEKIACLLDQVDMEKITKKSIQNISKVVSGLKKNLENDRKLEQKKNSNNVKTQ
jgi:hypothetical protein